MVFTIAMKMDRVEAFFILFIGSIIMALERMV